MADAWRGTIKTMMLSDRIKNLVMRTTGKPQGILVLTMALSYALGLLRDRLFAVTFGAGSSLDAYQAAFLVPDLLLNFLVAGGLGAVFVPLYVEARQKDLDHARLFARATMTFFTLLMLAVAIALVAFAAPLSRFVAPGFNVTERATLISLLRILAFSPVIFAASNAMGNILIAHNRYFTYGLSPVCYNLGIIGGTLLLAPAFGIKGVAYGTVAGAALHLAIRLVELKMLHYPIRPSFAFRLPEAKPFLKLMIPKMFGHPVELATLWGYTAIASTLAAGSIAMLNFARNFMLVPVSIIGIPLATVAFTALSEARANGEYNRFHDEYRRIFWRIAALSSAGAFVLFAFRKFIIGILLGGGEFGAPAIAKTASLLGAFALSIPLEAVSHLQVRAYYATKNTMLPTLAGLANFILSVGVAWLFVPRIGLLALPFAYALGSLCKVVMQAVFLNRRQ